MSGVDKCKNELIACGLAVGRWGLLGAHGTIVPASRLTCSRATQHLRRESVLDTDDPKKRFQEKNWGGHPGQGDQHM